MGIFKRQREIEKLYRDKRQLLQRLEEQSGETSYYYTEMEKYKKRVRGLEAEIKLRDARINNLSDDVINKRHVIDDLANENEYLKEIVTKLKAEKTAQEWTSVDKALPTDKKEVLIAVKHEWDNDYLVRTGRYIANDEAWIDNRQVVYTKLEVSYWHPLPKLPKGEGKCLN